MARHRPVNVRTFRDVTLAKPSRGSYPQAGGGEVVERIVPLTLGLHSSRRVRLFNPTGGDLFQSRVPLPGLSPSTAAHSVALQLTLGCRNASLRLGK